LTATGFLNLGKWENDLQWESAKRRLELRNLSRNEVMSAIETVYLSVPENEKRFEVVIRDRLKLSKLTNAEPRDW
jgi:hypothetical protein